MKKIFQSVIFSAVFFALSIAAFPPLKTWAETIVAPMLISPTIIGGSTTANAPTATALATTPAECGTGFYARGIDASGSAVGCTVAAGGGTVTSVSGVAGTTGLNVSVTNSTTTPEMTISISGVLAASISGNASSVTTNANLTGPVTSVGNSTAIADGAIATTKIGGTSTHVPYFDATGFMGTDSALTFNDTTKTLSASAVSLISHQSLTAGGNLIELPSGAAKLHGSGMLLIDATSAVGSTLTAAQYSSHDYFDVIGTPASGVYTLTVPDNLGGIIVADNGMTGGTFSLDIKHAATSAVTVTQAMGKLVLPDNGTSIEQVPQGSGSVTQVSIATASGVSGTCTNASTTPDCTISLGAIIPTSVAATGTVTGSNFTGTKATAAVNADTVTTNANLTGVITSVGNATSIASQTGTGTKFVMDTGPTIAGVATFTGTLLSSGDVVSTADVIDLSATPVASYTASKSGTTVTATVGTFSTADVNRIILWNVAGVLVYDRIASFISSSQVTVDHAGTIASQSATTYGPPHLYIDNTNNYASIGLMQVIVPANGSSFGVSDGKSARFTNSITIAGTDNSTLNVGGGGTLGTNAYTSTAYVPQTTTVNGKALSGNITLGLASADFANQGTTSTLLHGNAAGNPSFGQVAIGSEVSGLGTGIATMLATPSSANIAAAVTDETGSGLLMFATSPTTTTPVVNGYTEGSCTATVTAGAITLSVTSIMTGCTTIATDVLINTAANTTVTLPVYTDGQSELLTVCYGGAHTLTFTAGAGQTIKYPGGTAPAATSVNGKCDQYSIKKKPGVADVVISDAGRNI